VVGNKADNTDMAEECTIYERLGFGTPFAVSAIHGLGEIDILEELEKKFEQIGFRKMSEQQQEDEEIRIAIIGKPNVGKSSFLNKILGYDRSVVSPKPGTTSDPVDDRIIWNPESDNPIPLVLVDTAGMKRKKYQNPDSIEHLSTLWALKVISKCSIALLLIDSKEGINNQDLRIANFVTENYKSSIIVYNKWDIVQQQGLNPTQDYIKSAREYLPLLYYSPVMFCSSFTGYKLRDIINKAIEISKNRKQKLLVNKIMHSINTSLLMKPPPQKKGKRMKIKFVSQADMSGPTLTLFVNDPELRDDSYERFLERRLREDFSTLEGSPLRFLYRKNERRDSSKKPSQRSNTDQPKSNTAQNKQISNRESKMKEKITKQKNLLHNQGQLK
jgi:GTP-binding protein